MIGVSIIFRYQKFYICIILNNCLHYYMFRCLGCLVLKAFLALNLVKIPKKMKNRNLTIKTHFQNQRLQGIKRNWKQSSVAKSGRWISGMDTPSNFFFQILLYTCTNFF